MFANGKLASKQTEHIHCNYASTVLPPQHSIINLNIKIFKIVTVSVKRFITFDTQVKMALDTCTLHRSVLSDRSGHCHASNSRWNLLIPLILRCLRSYHGNRSGLRWWHLTLHNSSRLNCSHW